VIYVNFVYVSKYGCPHKQIVSYMWQNWRKESTDANGENVRDQINIFLTLGTKLKHKINIKYQMYNLTTIFSLDEGTHIEFCNNLNDDGIWNGPSCRLKTQVYVPIIIMWNVPIIIHGHNP
jgi:hypothetical protein